jgi:type II secretory pathway component PulM
MTGRDRLVVLSIAMLAILAGGWMLLVSPERKQAAAAQSKIESARQELQSAQSQANSERSAEAGYAAAYVSVVKLGKAVPPSEEVPSLVYELEQATHQQSVNFKSIASGDSTASAASAGASPSAHSGTAAAALSAFTQMPFTFVFAGNFFQLAHLLGQIDGFASTLGTSAASPDGLQDSGRLLTIQGVDVTNVTEGGGAGANSQLTATITASAYVLPASQGLTNGATPAGPAGVGGGPGAAAAASASRAASSSGAAPASAAVIEGHP